MIEVRCSMTFLVIYHSNWHQHHVMQPSLLMALLHSLGQDNQMKCNMTLFGLVTPLAPAAASHDADSFVSSSIIFICPSDQSEMQNEFFFFGHAMPLVPVCHLMLMASFHSLSQDDRRRCNLTSCHVMPLALVLASHDAFSILNVTITFLRS